jgi:hypothetical protein
MDVAAAVASVVDRLTAGGVRAYLDERDVNPPCVFVTPPAVAWRFGRGDFTATFTVWAVTGAAGRNVDLTNLGALLEQAAAALGFAAVTAEPADLLLPHEAAPLPAYRMTWKETVRQPITATTREVRNHA